MELQRNEYPAMLASLQPSQATQILNDRVKYVDRVNSEIADWLQERRRVEEVYISGLRKLARKQPPDESSELGVFQGPWTMIANSMEALAESHHLFARKIQVDVEKPLREFATHNREMQQMSTIQGNLNAMAKEYDAAQRKVDKSKGRGNRSDDLESASSQWESQAPYVFETLQAVDESRCNHLRDILTQYQTHEVDSVEKNRVAAEQCLNALLNVETAEEIKAFSRKNSGSNAAQQQKRARRDSRVLGGPVQASTSTPSTVPAQSPPRNTLAPPSRPTNGDDQTSQRSINEGDDGMIQEKKRGFGGIKRLGTVLSRKRQSTMPGSKATPAKKESSSSRFGSSLRPDRSDRAQRIPEATPSPPRSRRSPSPAMLPPVDIGERLDSSHQAGDTSIRTDTGATRTNGISQPPRGSSLPVNGDGATRTSYYPPPGQSSYRQPEQPPLPSKTVQEPRKDEEGFSVPAPSSDPISQAQAEAADMPDNSNQQFKVDIKNAPISEEGPAAETAMANVASQLRASGPTRRTGTLRGRRDVRNTVFVPNPTTEPPPPIEQQIPGATTSFPPTSYNPPAFPTPPPIKEAQTFPQTQSPTLASIGRHGTGLEDITPFTPGGVGAATASDTQSVRSNRSLSSITNVIKHPDMQGPGLNASIVETVSATIEHGSVVKCSVIGELALAHNSPFISAPSSPTSPMDGPQSETIRLDNFPILEKVAPNPAFVNQLPDRPGEYNLDIPSLSSRTQVAFKYQLHLDDASLSSHCPVIITPNWKIEPNQASAIVTYTPNPLFHASSSLTLTNLILVLHLEGNIRTTSCQSKPTGTFSREKALIYWKLDPLTIASGEQKVEKLLARFSTDGPAKQGRVETRWEISTAAAVGVASGTESLGSGLSVSKLDAQKQGMSDPFTDEASAGGRGKDWSEVGVMRRLIAGNYIAS